MSDPKRRPGFLAMAWTLLRWPVALGVLGWLVYQNVYLNADQLASRSVNWWALGVAAACYGGALLLTYFRWFLLVRAQDFAFTYPDAVRLGLVGMLFNFVAPGSVGGDVVKGAMIAKQQDSRRLIAASTVFLDRCLGTLGLFIFGVIAYLCLPPAYRESLEWMAWLFAFGVALGVTGLAIALWPRLTNARWIRAMTEWRYVGRVLRGALHSVELYQAKWRVVVGCVVLSIFGHLVMLSTYVFCSVALARGSAVPDAGPQYVFGAGSNFIQAFVPTPGGTGAFEGAYASGFFAADRTKVRTLRAEHATGSTPPQWQEALTESLQPKHSSELSKVIVSTDGLTADHLRATLTDVVEGNIAATAAFDTGVTTADQTVPADVIWSAYEVGHTAMAFREGLFAALGFRVLTVLVAIVGAVFYILSRREIDTAMEGTENASPDEDSPPTAEPREWSRGLAEPVSSSR